jgi:hypothetical protein
MVVEVPDVVLFGSFSHRRRRHAKWARARLTFLLPPPVLLRSLVLRRLYSTSTRMGRSSTPSVSRVYADVNAKLGPSWHEYGQLVC